MTKREKRKTLNDMLNKFGDCMKINILPVLFCSVLFCAAAYAGDVELQLALTENTIYQDESSAAEIKIINTSTASVTVLKPVEGSNIWVEIRDSSGTYVTTRPINLKKNSSKELMVLEPEGSISLNIEIPATVKSPAIPVKSTSAIAGINVRLRERLNGVNLRPGRYSVKAVYMSGSVSVSESSAAAIAENWTGAVTSNGEAIYVKQRD